NPNPIPLSSYTPAGPSSQNTFDDDDPDAEYEDEEAEDEGGDSKQPPFKFHRIWPESDEIRFLQGLLGCWSQGLVFPRDLNIFYDRFSESMSQPYTRSQLSEKLRRLRKKYRTMAGRIARGQDPSRLSQHDRDLLHLSTRLWDPSNASTSPFSAPDAVAAGSAGNKRRRPNPRAPTSRARASSSPHQVIVALESALLPPPNPPLALPSTSPVAYKKECMDPLPSIGHNGSIDGANFAASPEEIPKNKLPTPPISSSVDPKRSGAKHLAIKSVLDVLDVALNEVRSTLANQGIISSNGTSEQGLEMKGMSKRWQAHRLAELDLLAQRWRLVVEEKATQI
ncbi:probable transcription factor At3g04930, partial [Phalaenopsis equestris]|uniref:probable transcription factor At3g04930 n=1 Tax=Phalaenopsis equestris TaxID=78828 RepID=UPI0009E4C910